MNFWKNHMDFSKKTIWIVWLGHNFENCPSMIFPSKLLEPAKQPVASPTHLPLTENRLKFFVPSNPTNNYENIYIWWHEIIKINLVSQALFEKTHFSVILYYKIDHFCPLNAIFTHFLPFDPMFGSGIHYYLVAIICWYK